MLLLSIITPMYNVGKYLSAFLDSLISAYNGDFEILLIDDGSTDSSLEIASEYSSAFPFIQIEHQKNSGPAVARNRGISHTSGQYIAFMDSDDYILPERFCSIIEEVKHHEAEMWISDFYRVADNGFVLDKVFQIKETTEPILDRAYIKEFLSAPDCVWNVWRCIFSREFLDRNSLRFIEGVNCAEDLEFMVRALSCVERVSFFHNPYYCYRVNYGKTLTRRYSAKRVGELTQMILCANRSLKDSSLFFAQMLQKKLTYEYILNLAVCCEVPIDEKKQAFQFYKNTWGILDESDSTLTRLMKKSVDFFGMKTVGFGLYCIKMVKRMLRALLVYTAQLSRKENE